MKAAAGAILLMLGIGLVVLYSSGRSLWYPYYAKLRGLRSVEEVVEQIKQSRDLPFEIKAWEELLLVGLKAERSLEVYGRRGAGGDWHPITAYPFTGYSGKLGPKLREGDRQIPEGIYRIESLNPNSSFHLSMKVNYPNQWDRQMGAEEGRERLGGDIFIHGKSGTVGCIPIGDTAIEELFILVATVGVDRCEVLLLPWDFRRRKDEPQVEEIEWEGLLYRQLREAVLEAFPEGDGVEAIETLGKRAGANLGLERWAGV
ncbi:MAG: murein L,D-transpeptidase family protein [Puniceicoccaceae bacterium]